MRVNAAMSEFDPIPRGVGRLRRPGPRRRLRALRCQWSADRLDINLARGADPWSSTDLMIRAAQLSAFPTRQRIGRGLVLLADAAALPTAAYSTRIAVRRELIREHREELLQLAERLQDPEPVGVAVVADLSLLIRDGGGPAYVGGRAPEELAAVTARSLAAIL